ncbi:hypothetical protein BOSE62_190040 [Bosea sp. 62]|nr:hypothetical protein BOSE21B_150013 [Bosea sp. 21B]CAD5291891.1 hypothetical protein BOSE46_70648 [Bosea sp. 46]CAD5300637.1 hypothetical protein BOSE7B_90040 [Bosea sp. 7B]VVT60766.1 hypothetical protein BOS5A_230043 [Bosea sp. EC-HK365B]VXC05454.1 hypothetical protein BOSE62_190040 [Bosea sp. 62]VXC59349.1 hypothetical protein BOSE127_230012 [Bosea sp. 127]VXC67094.1 hypothetical protein BOSE29B_50617 [Bosea sp. 29B]VXC97273.1 hypothetical protein BOSE125_850007 [Bosea sp. 125]
MMFCFEVFDELIYELVVDGLRFSMRKFISALMGLFK